MRFINLTINKIPIVLAAILLMLILLVGFEAWKTIDNMNTRNAVALQTATDYELAVNTARNAQVRFKIQVQEWKDTLLRGKDPNDYAKYRQAFEAESQKTEAELIKLRTMFVKLRFETVMVDEAINTHRDLYKSYTSALAQFDPNSLESAHVVDKIVRGIDRVPTIKMENMVDYILEKSNSLVVEQELESTKNYQLARKQLSAVLLLSFSLGIAITYFMVKKAASLEQDRLKAANEQLEQRVEERSQELKVVMQHMMDSERLASLGGMVAGVAHELNTPIGNCVGVASTMQVSTKRASELIRTGKMRRSGIESFLENELHGHEILKRNMERAAELVVSFKHVAVDQSSNKRREFHLSQLIEENVLSLEQSYKRTPFKLNTDLKANVLMDSFPGPLGQIVTNFITNAMAHAFEGREAGVMSLSTRLIDAEFVELVFSDDGNGISEKNLKHIFEPFFTTKRGKGGSGLGLSIVYNLVHRVLGGEIEVYSAPNAGTTFRVTLPVSAPEIAAAQ